MKHKTLKYLLFAFCLFLSSSYASSQDGIGSWKIFRSYQEPTLVSETASKVFAVYNGALLSYNPEDEEVRIYNQKNGLNDVSIKCMEYSPDHKLLVLVYENANIDLFYGENDVLNLPFIKDDIYTQVKTINNLELIDGLAYISTAFGIVVVDLSRGEVKETYRLGVDTRSVTRYGDTLYAVTTEGIRQASISSNLLDRENWKTSPITYPGNIERASKILFFQDKMVIAGGNQIYYQNSETTMQLLWNHTLMDFKIIGDEMVACSAFGMITFFQTFTHYTRINIQVNKITPSSQRDHYWCTTADQGLILIQKEKDASDYTIKTTGIAYNSPIRNDNYKLAYNNNKLYVTGGGANTNRADIAGTLMVYDGKSWLNYDSDKIAEATGVQCKDFLSIAFDPKDPQHFFVSSWGEGVYEFESDEFKQRYYVDNSTLESALTNNPTNYVRTNGMAFDKDNNLWVLNGGGPDVVNGLHKRSPDGSWESFYYPALAAADGKDIIVSSKNQKWIIVWRENGDSNPSISVLDGDNFYSSETFTDNRGTAVSAQTYLSIVEDDNGTIWVGTDVGPISFSSSSQVESGRCSRIVLADEYGAGYYLLENQPITAIAVDGANRKWMGTRGGGVYIVDLNDSENAKIDNLTKENSYLLSNTINSIAIDKKTGEVFIGTDQGICSYMSEASEGQSNYSNVYAYPNPVYLSRNDQVVITGLMQNTNLKITDLSGNLMKEATSLGGQYIWDCTDKLGRRIKAGMYLVFGATQNGSEGVVTKVVAIN